MENAYIVLKVEPRLGGDVSPYLSSCAGRHDVKRSPKICEDPISIWNLDVSTELYLERPSAYGRPTAYGQ
jgi:hypothetical protein